MNFRKVRLVLPMLFTIAAIAIASTSHAQVSATFRVSFGSTPHWTAVPGTQVEVIGDVNRPSYDVFRFGGSYYAYSNDRWYTSRRPSGDYVEIQDTMVPTEIFMVPRERWQTYPSRWERRGQGPNHNWDQDRNETN